MKQESISRAAFLKQCAAAAGGSILPGFPILASATASTAGDEPVRRGSWVRTGAIRTGDLELTANGGCVLTIGSRPASAIRQAALFLAADIYKISGYRPPISADPIPGRPNIRLVTAAIDEFPPGLAVSGWEAYSIVTDGQDCWLAGADFRGTVFAAYTLAERLGIDPLYLWTGYEPEKHERLVLKKMDFYAPPPAFRFRGFFHDDEDILQRPFEDSGYPLRFGDIPLEWYQRYFETALRLGMNMVAPYTRAHRRNEVQECASSWGLFYTSHHYDILLSNPFGIERFNLAEKRKVDPTWDWFTNRQGMIDYWKGGVEENKDLYAIWPVGLRGTDDHAYNFPPDMPTEKRSATFREVLDRQVQMVEQALPPDHAPLFHFTLYTEMLEQYLQDPAAFDVPEKVTIVWPDDNNGIMRQLPVRPGKWKHGVYYHLAYFGGNNSKQVFHPVSPTRIAEQFKRILDAGATEFLLVNTTELREFVMEARMIAEIAREGKIPGGDDYIRWWCREYFGTQEAAALYLHYYNVYPDAPSTWAGTDAVQQLLDALYRRFNRLPYTIPPPPAPASKLPAAPTLDRQQEQFLFEQLTLGLLFDSCTRESAGWLWHALTTKATDLTWQLIDHAIRPLEKLEIAILRSERPPFEKWYRETWIRPTDSPLNLHRPYEQVRAFVASGGKVSPIKPPVKQGHRIQEAKRWTRFLEDQPQPSPDHRHPDNR